MTELVAAFLLCCAVSACVVAIGATTWASEELADARTAERYAEHLEDLLVAEGWTREALDRHHVAWSRQQEQARWPRKGF